MLCSTSGDHLFRGEPMNVLTYVHLRNISKSTGAGRVARQITEHLAQRSDVQMHILADANDYRRVISDAGRPWTEFRYHLFEADTSTQQARWVLRGNPCSEDYCPAAQIVYCTGESYVPTRKQRLAVTVHDAAIFERGAHRPSILLHKQRAKWRLLYRILARRADLFHTVSHFSAERLSHYFPQISSRLRVVYNAASERFFAPVSECGEQFLERAGLRTRPYILLPGGLHFRKNAETALKAWAVLKDRLKEYRLVIAGHSQPDYSARALTLGDSVVQTGFVDDDVLCSLYRAARAVWFPSLYEGFGVPVLEAMACGAPVVGSNCTSIPEVAGDAALLVGATRIDDHVQALESICERAQLRSELRARGFARAGQFSWANSAEKLAAHFRSIL